MNRGTTLNAQELSALLAQGEGESIEFKRSTGELKEAMQTLCAFLNGIGGTVLFGVRPDGTAEGQDVSDKTLREIAQVTERFEPAVHLTIRRGKAKARREVVAVSVEGGLDKRPFTYDGRPYERIGNSTRRMAQSRYEKTLLDRAHATRRWENEPAERVELRDIDRDEVFRIVNIAASLGRLSGPVGARLADILDRLRLRREGKILQAAVVLFGKEFMPDYPQCELRMARFKGTDKTEFMDQRQVRAPAFKLLEESEMFCQRHFPMPAKIVPGQLRRVEATLIPVDAMREILVNAIIHRDYSIAGGSISLAIFDDRVEVWSAGAFPTGITPEQLSKSHLSVQRNPIIADVFNRAGLIEKWGRGTNRVIAMCREAGIAPPEFEEITGAAVVTFRVRVGETARPEVGSKVESGVESQPEFSTSPVPVQFQSLEDRILASLRNGALPVSIISKQLGQKRVSGRLKVVLKTLLSKSIIEFTIPDKPNSRLQKYRLTRTGKRVTERRSK
ncbi:MAG: putative DNA binding domain-containing protein [Candidatus Omnitrophica bacterium]|nr:putative DNA binding domain-containing protein [Candidatus Omnitrophota bacterium]